MANARLGDILREAINDPLFDQARTPFAAIATDISTGERVVLDRGDVITAVMASACVPGLFQPVEREGRLLVDGGLVENLPTSVLRPMGARTVVGVDLNTARDFHEPGDVTDVILNAIDIAINNATRLQVGQGIELPIAPQLTSYSRVRTSGEALLAEGYEAAARALQGWHGLSPPEPGYAR
jgi:NTE family protein